MSYFKSKSKYKEEEAPRSRETIKSVAELPLADMGGRGLKPETVAVYDVREALSEEDGTTPVAWYFPYYTTKGTLCGWKKKDLLGDRSDKWHWTTIGKQGVSCQMFGQTVASQAKRKRKQIAIVEGEIDCMSVYQIMVDSVAGGKYDGLTPFVVSLSNGTGNAVENIIHNQKFIDSFAEVVLAFDADSATPSEAAKGIVKGAECTQAVASHLIGPDRKLFVGVYPQDCKDANEALEEGQEEAIKKGIYFEPETYVVEKVMTASQLVFEDLIKPREEGVYIEAFPELMHKIHGFRKRELSVLTSLSGVGKTTVVSEIANSLGVGGYRVGLIFLEEEELETEQRLLARRLELPFNSFKDNPLAHKTKEEVYSAYEWTCAEDRYIFLDHFGSLKVSELMAKIKSMYYINKVDFIILDHLSMVVSGSESANERRELDLLMTELAAFCASHDVGILAVSHLNRNAADEIRGISKLTEPMWVKVKKEDLKGSSSLEQLSWMIFGLDFELLPDRTRGRTRITCLKNRPWGYLGEADTFKMNDKTGLLERR